MATGAKNSRRNAGLLRSTWVSTVGSRKNPGRSSRTPPSTISGATVDSRVDLLKRPLERSLTGEWTQGGLLIKRIAWREGGHLGCERLNEVIEECLVNDEAFGARAGLPGVLQRPRTASRTASSSSAASRMMKASLPPSSIVLFFSALPASAATACPARSLPGEGNAPYARISDHVSRLLV